MYKIINCGNYLTIVNTKGKRENHCHINKGSQNKMYKTANMLIRLVRNKRVPRSDYLRQSAYRLTTDKRYRRDIKIKIEKDRDKDRNNRQIRRW